MGRVAKTGHTIPFHSASFLGDQTPNHTHRKKYKKKLEVIIVGQRGKQLEHDDYRKWNRKFFSSWH